MHFLRHTHTPSSPILQSNFSFSFLSSFLLNPLSLHTLNRRRQKTGCLIKSFIKITMADTEDLGLSLSLSFPEINKKPSLNSSFNLIQKTSWPQTFLSSDRSCSETCREETRSGTFLKVIDVNRAPASGDEEEEAGVSSPNSTISSISGKRSVREANGSEEPETERTSSRGISDEEDGGETSRKKLRLSKDQSAVLEDSFKEHSTLNPKQKLALAKRLGLRPRQVEVWFQNRRARTKFKQTEVDCEFLKRCCENLTEENRRLQKEVQELRALKMSPQFYMQMTPPTTLNMCPSCERSAVSTSGALPVHQHRPVSFTPWAAASPTPHRPFDVLRSRS